MQNQIMWLDFKKFLETKYKDDLFYVDVDRIANCSECNSNKCKHIARLYLDKSKKFIGFIRDEFSRWLQQNKKIAVSEPFKLDLQMINKILFMTIFFGLHKIINDDIFDDYISWIQDIIRNYVNFNPVISNGSNDNRIFTDIITFAEEIFEVKLNRDSKRKLGFSLTKNLIDSIKYEKFSGFDNIECLSARIVYQALLCNKINDLDDFQALMNFLHTELKIENGTLNAEAIEWISDTIFFEFPVKASKCFDLLRLQSKNNLSPSILLNFIKNVVNFRSWFSSNYDGANKFITEELNKWGKEERNKFIEEHDLIMDYGNNLYKSKYKYAYLSILSILQDLARLEFNEMTDLLSFGGNYTLPDPQDSKYKQEVNRFFELLSWVLSNSKEELDFELIQKIVCYINKHMKIKLPKNIDEYKSGRKLNQMLYSKCGGLVLSVSDDRLTTQVIFNGFVKFKINNGFFGLSFKLKPKVYSEHYAEELIKLIDSIRDEFLKLSLNKNINDKSQLRFDIDVFTKILKQSCWFGYYTEYNSFEDYFKWLRNVIKNDILFPEEVTKTTKKYIADFLEAATDGVDIKDHNMKVSRLKLKSGILDEINKVTELNFSVKDFVSADKDFGDMEFYDPNLDDIKFLFEFIKNNQIDVSLGQLNDLSDRFISLAGKCFKWLDYQSDAQKAIEYVKYVLNTFEQNMTEIFKSLIQKYKAEQKENNDEKVDWKQILKFVDNKMLHALGLKISIDENGHVEMQKDLSVIESSWLNKKNYGNCYKAAKAVLMLNGKEGLKYFIQHYPYNKRDCFLKLSSDESKQKFIDVAANVFFSIVDTESNPTGYSLEEIFDAVEYFVCSSGDFSKKQDMTLDMLRKYYSNNIQCVEKCDKNVKQRLCCWIENFWIFDMDARTKILDAMVKAKGGILQANDLETMDLFLIKHFVFGLKPEETFAPKNKAKKDKGNVLIPVEWAIAFALRKVISSTVHAFINAKENKKNNRCNVAIDDLFIMADVAEMLYHDKYVDLFSYTPNTKQEVANERWISCRKIVNAYFEDEIPKLCEKIKNDQIEETVLKRILRKYHRILSRLSEDAIKIISMQEEQAKEIIIDKVENTIVYYMNNKVSKNLDKNSLKETIVLYFKLFLMLDNISSKTNRTVYFKLVEIIKNDVNKYSEQIMRDSTGEYDLQKIIDKYCDISKTFSEAVKMSENDAEETRKNICNAIKNASLAFIENDLKSSCDRIKSGQLDKSNLQNIQDKYYKMLDTLYRNGTIAKEIVDKKKEAIKTSVDQLKSITVEQSEGQSESKTCDLKNESEIPAQIENETKFDENKDNANELKGEQIESQKKSVEHLEKSKICDLKNESEIPAQIENETKPDENENNVNELKDAQIESQKKTHDNTPILKAKVKMVSDSDNKTNDLESMIKEDIAGIYYENEYHALEKFDVKEKYNKYITKLNEPKILRETTELKYIDLKNRLDNIFKVNIVFVCFYWIGQIFAFICPGFSSKNAIAGIKNPRTKIIFDRLCYNFCSGINCLGGQSSFSNKIPIIVKSGDNHNQPNLEEGHSNTRY